MGKEKDSPREKLLGACGVEMPRPAGKPAQEPEGKNYFETLVNQADQASASAQQAQEQTEKLYRQFKSYVNKDLPNDLVAAFEQVVKEGIEAKLQPLDQGITAAAQQVGKCTAELAGMSWNSRFIWIAMLIGMGTVLVGGCMMRLSFFGDDIREAQEKEVLGRKVSRRLETSSTKDQDRFEKWLQGESLVPEPSQKTGARTVGKPGRPGR
ncbi:hypothetical protein GMLC_07960 [Geomonas limicola]|uniref:Uncharacterized protein n=1 Tax=Geomonas limicola TaxID=2740186 RepID=A0A6V8N5W6_9BACT|nr:hypothetical protein [Geomonas limicola]GFO67217.1 hypothetical protein GMLC_07960 [Geomonas limicola]